MFHFQMKKTLATVGLSTKLVIKYFDYVPSQAWFFEIICLNFLKGLSKMKSLNFKEQPTPSKQIGNHPTKTSRQRRFCYIFCNKILIPSYISSKC